MSGRQPPRGEGRDEIDFQLTDWAQKVRDEWLCPYGCCGGRLRHLCSRCEDELEGSYAALAIERGQQAAELTRRWWPAPEAFAEAVDAAGLADGVVLHLDTNPLTPEARAGIWPLLTRLLAPYSGQPPCVAHPLDPDTDRGATSHPVIRELACEAVPRFSPSPEDAAALLTPLLADADCGARGYAALHLETLAPDTPGLRGAFLSLLGCSCRRQRPGVYRSPLDYTSAPGEEDVPWWSEASARVAVPGFQFAPDDVPHLVAAVACGHPDPCRVAAGALGELGVASVPALKALAVRAFPQQNPAEPTPSARAALDALLTRGAATGTEAALLQSIFANPADELARLVYADWLQENGDPVAARHIRREVRGGDGVPDEYDGAQRGGYRGGDSEVDGDWLCLWSYVTTLPPAPPSEAR